VFDRRHAGSLAQVVARRRRQQPTHRARPVQSWSSQPVDDGGVSVPPASPARRTIRAQRGDAAEALVSQMLSHQGWQVLGRQVRVGRAELDIVAVDPGPPATLVAVEVRSRTSDRFGSQEERLDGAKVRRLYRAMTALRTVAALPDGAPLPTGLAWRVDLVAVDLPSGRMRHLVGLIPR
jgi:putative endonuclease